MSSPKNKLLQGKSLKNRAIEIGVSLNGLYDSNGVMDEPELQRRVLEAEKSLCETGPYDKCMDGWNEFKNKPFIWPFALIVFFLIAGVGLYRNFEYIRAKVWDTNENTQITARPILHIEENYDTKNNPIGIYLNNSGASPALIKSLKIFYKEEMEMEIEEFGRAIYNHLSRTTESYGELYYTTKRPRKNSPIAAEKQIPLFQIHNQDTTKPIQYEIAKRIDQYLKEFNFVVVYKDLYGNEFSHKSIP